MLLVLSQIGDGSIKRFNRVAECSKACIAARAQGASNFARAVAVVDVKTPGTRERPLTDSTSAALPLKHGNEIALGHFVSSKSHRGKTPRPTYSVIPFSGDRGGAFATPIGKPVEPLAVPPEFLGRFYAVAYAASLFRRISDRVRLPSFEPSTSLRRAGSATGYAIAVESVGSDLARPELASRAMEFAGRAISRAFAGRDLGSPAHGTRHRTGLDVALSEDSRSPAFAYAVPEPAVSDGLMAETYDRDATEGLPYQLDFFRSKKLLSARGKYLVHPSLGITLSWEFQRSYAIVLVICLMYRFFTGE